MKFTRTDHEIVRPFYKYIGKDRHGTHIREFRAIYHAVFVGEKGHCYISNAPLENVMMSGDRQKPVRRPLVRQIAHVDYKKTVPADAITEEGKTYTPIPYLIENGRLVALEIYVPKTEMVIDKDEREERDRLEDYFLSTDELLPDFNKITNYIGENFPDIEEKDLDTIIGVIDQHSDTVYSKSNTEFALMNYDRLKKKIKYLPDAKMYSYDFADKVVEHQKKIGKLDDDDDRYLSDATINRYHPIIIFFVVLGLAQKYAPAEDDTSYALSVLWLIMYNLSRKLELLAPVDKQSYKVLENTVLMALDSYITRGEPIEEAPENDPKILAPVKFSS